MQRLLYVPVSAVAVLCLSALLQATALSLPEAAKLSDRDAVRAMLKAGADVNTAAGDGMTALHWAAINNDVELTKLLIQARANVNVTTRLGGYTPLLLAAKDGHVATVNELIRAGADPNRATTNGTTPLMLAAASGKTESVAALLERGAQIDATETKGETALMFAAARGRTEVIRALTARGADVKATASVIDLTVKPPVPPPPEPGRLVLRADDSQLGRAGGNYEDNVLRQGWGGLAALHFAARQGYMDSAKALLAAGADINQPSAGDTSTPLMIATINGHFDLAKFLLEQGADAKAATVNGATPLYAVLNVEWAPSSPYPNPRAQEQQRTTYLELMKALLDKGADPNARTNKKVWYASGVGVNDVGATPFWRAAAAGDLEAMRLLVARGADPNVWTTKMRERRPGAHDPGQLAEVKGYVSPLPPVPIGGADVSPLQAVVASSRVAPTGTMAAVKYLVEELHLDVNAADEGGTTVLHEAAANGDNELVLYLLSKGANPLAVNRKGLTTVDMANGPEQKVQPFPETIALLEKLGAKNNHVCVSC